jgi:hypothetical protein
MAVQSVIGYSINLDEPYEAGIEIGETVLKKLDLKTSSIGILFANIDFDFEKLLKGIYEELNIPVIGCTTASEANNEGYFEESASLMVITSDDLKIGLGIGQDLSKDHEKAVCSAYEAARAMMEDAEPKLGITFPDSALTGSADRILNILVNQIGKEVPIVGGIPGDNFKFEQTYQFFGSSVYKDSVPLLLLAGDIHPTVVTRSGWIPVGQKATATKVSGNTIFEIDNQPAIEYLEKYIPDLDDPVVMGSFPLAILDDALGSDVYKYFVIRSPFFYNKEDGSVVYLGDIPENATIQMARGSREDILDGMREAIATLKKRVKDRVFNCLLLFSCAARKLMLGLDTEKEIEIALSELPDHVSINGFYTYGEIGPIDSSIENLNQNKFHNTSIVLCAF